MREGFAAGDAGGADAAFAEAFLTEYVGALEELPASIEEVDEVEVTSVVARGSTTAGCSSDILSRYIDSLYEDQVRKEQERISKQVAERSVVGKPPKAAKGGKRKPSAANSSDASSGAPTGQEEASDEARAALRAKILGDLKERGRVKWRVLARMIMTSLKTAMCDDKIVISSTKKGTHFSFRLKSKDASGGATVVRLHRRRKDRTASVGEARGLVDELIELVFKILQQQ